MAVNPIERSRSEPSFGMIVSFPFWAVQAPQFAVLTHRHLTVAQQKANGNKKAIIGIIPWLNG
jgi:hypothetical protein